MLQTTDDLKEPAEKLSHLDFVSQYDDDENREAWTIAFALAEICESLTNINGQFLPRLIAVKEPEAHKETLFDIGDELKHILYHIRDMRFYAYLDALDDGSRL
jgi:hypothetical protein